MVDNFKTAPIEDGMVQLGLTKYESRAYVSLLMNNDLTAEDLSRICGISPSRIYDTLSSLSRNGIVTVVNTKPKRYHAVGMEAAVSALVSRGEADIRKSLEELKSVEQRILSSVEDLPKMNNIAEKNDFVGMLRGKESLENWLRGMIRNAGGEVLVFAGDMDCSQHDVDRLKMLSKRGATVKILAEISKKNKDMINEAKKSGIEVRDKPKGVDLRGFIFDKKSVYISNKIVIGSQKRGANISDYSALITNSKPLIKALRDYFQMLWDPKR